MGALGTQAGGVEVEECSGRRGRGEGCMRAGGARGGHGGAVGTWVHRPEGSRSRSAVGRVVGGKVEAEGARSGLGSAGFRG